MFGVLDGEEGGGWRNDVHLLVVLGGIDHSLREGEREGGREGERKGGRECV